MNYKLIHDASAIHTFLNSLPDLEENEKFYGCLFARKKYADELSNVKDSTLVRFVFKKEELLIKLIQMETEVGSYIKKGQMIPQEALAVYMMPNPRCLRKASFSTLKRLATELEDGNKPFAPQSVAMTAIHNSKSRAEFVSFDIDEKVEQSKILENLEDNKGTLVIQTRGGYHAHVRPKLQTTKKWHPELMQRFKDSGIHIDVTGDMLSPIPGAFQGNFCPTLTIV